MGLGELCECFQAALLGRLYQGRELRACLEGWVKFSQQEQGLPSLGLGVMDSAGMIRNTWVLNGLAKLIELQGGCKEESTYMSPSRIRSLPFQGLAHLHKGWLSLTPASKKLANWAGGTLTNVGMVIDELGGPLIALRVRRQGLKASQDAIDGLFGIIPLDWLEILSGGRGGEVRLATNPTPENLGVRRAKEISSERRDDPVVAKWGEEARGRSELFLLELRRSSASLFWFQHLFSLKVYFLGDRTKHFTDSDSACMFCRTSLATYSHVAFFCDAIAARWAAWDATRPQCWSPSQGAKLGYPSASKYEALGDGDRKGVLQWLIRGIEIKKAAFFSYFAASRTPPFPPPT
jgi:hypothetical protein